MRKVVGTWNPALQDQLTQDEITVAVDRIFARPGDSQYLMDVALRENIVTAAFNVRPNLDQLYKGRMYVGAVLHSIERIYKIKSARNLRKEVLYEIAYEKTVVAAILFGTYQDFLAGLTAAFYPRHELGLISLNERYEQRLTEITEPLLMNEGEEPFYHLSVVSQWTALLKKLIKVELLAHMAQSSKQDF